MLAGLEHLQANTKVNALEDNVFKWSGSPCQIISASFASLNSTTMKEVCRLLNITKKNMFNHGFVEILFKISGSTLSIK